MSSFIATPLNTFSADIAAEHPEKLHKLSKAFGHLFSIQPIEGCQIAQIDDRLIALPQDLNLAEYIGQDIGLMRYEDEVLVRRLGVA